ncbi:lysophospholipid acyltransferase family protein [Salinarimonas ramus]|uniref:Acyltransferase n=1 Tax=Salinarimonas ramus TaxID=690164 RepID=A0A917Q444_9HYPH|nr:lysophospholipid acyltransferase family protein [Salinarimonas ramus]GGK22665.1 acyltransferase [Salinarimonas ramus]
MADPRAKAARLAARLPASERPTALRDPRRLKFFTLYFRRYFVKHMNALRLAPWGAPRVPDGVPVVLYTNHPAWWDAATYMIAADKFFPQRQSYAPIDAEMLEAYGFMKRIGAYGIDLESPKGAAHFLAASADILSRDDAVIFLAAQGRFMDVRTRPVGLRAGVARLPEIAPHALFVPMAMEYQFWEQRGAEAFVAFGDGETGADLLALDREARRTHLEERLTGVLDRLSSDVMSRDPARFETVLSGEAGVGGIYGLWKRALAAMKGERYEAAHGRRPTIDAGDDRP